MLAKFNASSNSPFLESNDGESGASANVFVSIHMDDGYSPEMSHDNQLRRSDQATPSNSFTSVIVQGTVQYSTQAGTAAEQVIYLLSINL